MKIKLALPTLVLGFLLAAPSSGEDAVPGARVSDYYPLKKDNTWKYKVTDGQELTMKVATTEKVGDTVCWRIETSANGKVQASEDIAVAEDGSILRYAVNSKKADEPIKFFPNKDEKEWTIRTKIEGQEVSGKMMLTEADVTVLGKSYPKAKVVEGKDFKIAGRDTSLKMWFAKGVGMVKLEFKLEGQDATMELVEFTPAP